MGRESRFTTQRSARPRFWALPPTHISRLAKRRARQQRNVSAQRPELVAFLRIYRKHTLRRVASPTVETRTPHRCASVGTRTRGNGAICIGGLPHELRLVGSGHRYARRFLPPLVFVLGRTAYLALIQARKSQRQLLAVRRNYRRSHPLPLYRQREKYWQCNLRPLLHSAGFSGSCIPRSLRQHHRPTLDGNLPLCRTALVPHIHHTLSCDVRILRLGVEQQSHFRRSMVHMRGYFLRTYRSRLACTPLLRHTPARFPDTKIYLA